MKSHRSYLDKAKKEVMAEMEFNWKIMHAIHETIVERNFLYGILSDIENYCDSTPGLSEQKKYIVDTLTHVPDYFAPVDDPEIAKRRPI